MVFKQKPKSELNYVVVDSKTAEHLQCLGFHLKYSYQGSYYFLHTAKIESIVKEVQTR